MITCKLDKLGVTVGRLGFGLMRLPMNADGTIDRAAAGKMVDRAMEAGVNYYDTAYGYHNKESQLFAREALVGKYPRDSFMLATKLPLWSVKTAEDVGSLFEEQLASCGVDYFDVYHMHGLGDERWPMVQELNIYDILAKKKAEGKIRHLGFSYHGGYETFCEALDKYEWDFVQIQINYLDNSMMEAGKLYKKLCEKNIACVVMEPVRGGFLATLPDEAASILKSVNNDSFAKWALRWCLDQSNMPVILSGMSTMEQLEENIDTFSSFTPLTAAEKDALERTAAAIQNIKTIPCTRCDYCMPCPFGVKIPGVFSVYNQYKQFNNPDRAKKSYKDLAEATADHCTKCGACLSKCPQSIAIPDRLEEAHAVISAL